MVNTAKTRQCLTHFLIWNYLCESLFPSMSCKTSSFAFCAHSGLYPISSSISSAALFSVSFQEIVLSRKKQVFFSHLFSHIESSLTVFEIIMSNIYVIISMLFSTIPAQTERQTDTHSHTCTHTRTYIYTHTKKTIT